MLWYMLLQEIKILLQNKYPIGDQYSSSKQQIHMLKPQLHPIISILHLIITIISSITPHLNHSTHLKQIKLTLQHTSSPSFHDFIINMWSFRPLHHHNCTSWTSSHHHCTSSSHLNTPLIGALGDNTPHLNPQTDCSELCSRCQTHG